MTAKPIAKRIESAYMALTGSTTPRGARVWFARQCRVRPWTVTRWLTDRRPFRGPPLAVLEQLEARAAALAVPTPISEADHD